MDQGQKMSHSIREMSEDDKVKVSRWMKKAIKMLEILENESWSIFVSTEAEFPLFLGEVKRCIGVLSIYKEKEWLSEDSVRDFESLIEQYKFWETISTGVDDVLKMGLFIEFM